MNWGSDFFCGRYTNELEDIPDQWIVVQFFFGRENTNELEDIRMNWGSVSFGIINVYFIFSIGGWGFWNPKIYEWIGRYTNELGFRFFFEDIRMNWKIYEWIVVQIFFGGENIRMNWKIYEWIGVQFFFWNNKYLYKLFLVLED